MPYSLCFGSDLPSARTGRPSIALAFACKLAAELLALDKTPGLLAVTNDQAP